MEIELQPFGQIDSEILNGLKEGLQGIFGCPVVVNKPIPLPEEALDQSRNQYLSDSLIEILNTSEGMQYLLGITEANLYTHGFNYVFGQAEHRGRAAIISLSLLKPENYGQPSDNKLLLERALKEAVHETGHVLGMGHCEDGKCVMHFSNSLIDTDVKGPYFCSHCRPALMI
jgi:archaemetzincin